MRDGPSPTARDFEAFYDAARNPVYRAVVLVTRQPDRAEEATAEAFARAFTHWDRLTDHPNPTAWVARTALNSFISSWRIWRREAYGVPDTLTASEEGRSLDPFLLRTLWRLPRRQREVVALRIILDLDARATAATLGIAEGTVGVHLKRALDHLREALAGTDYEGTAK
jgi:RNA polymerase sigma factor (sigma-70 family)